MKREDYKDWDGTSGTQLFVSKVRPDDNEIIEMHMGSGSYAGRIGLQSDGVYMTKGECQELIDTLLEFMSKGFIRKKLQMPIRARK